MGVKIDKGKNELKFESSSTSEERMEKLLLIVNSLLVPEDENVIGGTEIMCLIKLFRLQEDGLTSLRDISEEVLLEYGIPSRDFLSGYFYKLRKKGWVVGDRKNFKVKNIFLTTLDYEDRVTINLKF